MPACVDNRNSVTQQELYNYLVAGDISRGRAECVLGVPPNTTHLILAMQPSYNSGKRLPYAPWNNGKEVPKLDLTSLTTPGQQIHKFNHTRTANLCDWLPCCRAAPFSRLSPSPHSLVYLHLPVVERLIFCISAIPHLGTSFPLFHDFIIQMSD